MDISSIPSAVRAFLFVSERWVNGRDRTREYKDCEDGLVGAMIERIGDLERRLRDSFTDEGLRVAREIRRRRLGDQSADESDHHALAVRALRQLDEPEVRLLEELGRADAARREGTLFDERRAVLRRGRLQGTMLIRAGCVRESDARHEGDLVDSIERFADDYTAPDEETFFTPLGRSVLHFMGFPLPTTRSVG